ncbi:hypothetical protein [Plantactinospora sonchi]|uniref:Uncharacterized protein n=1 Tax=Plantactinospora sonchi TaxID=1544735 RepID=A0ABU7S3K1_9ACTN
MDASDWDPRHADSEPLRSAEPDRWVAAGLPEADVHQGPGRSAPLRVTRVARVDRVRRTVARAAREAVDPLVRAHRPVR